MKKIIGIILALAAAVSAQTVQVKSSSGTVTFRTPAQLRSDMGLAASGSNADITSLTGITSLGAFTSRENVFPFNTFAIDEDFLGYSGSDGTIGSHGWRAFDIAGSGSAAPQPGSGSTWGVMRSTTGAGSNDARWLGLGGTASGAVLDDLDTLVPWTSWFRFQVSRTTNAFVLIGFINDPFSNPTTSDQLALRFDTASDSTFKVLCRSAGTSTVTDTTVTPVATTYYALKIWSATAGTIKFQLYSAAGVAVGSEVTIATNVPGTVMCPGFYHKSLTTSAHSIDADAFRLMAKLTR